MQTGSGPAPEGLKEGPADQVVKKRVLDEPWRLSFVESAPVVEKSFVLDSLCTWESLGDPAAAVTMGTGAYVTNVTLTPGEATSRWEIELGDVRESARVYVNGTFIGCAWAAPFRLDCGTALKEGNNEIRIDVTNLPANRISDMDRRGVRWRIFKDINMVDINYKPSDYSSWAPVPSGLNSPVSLVRYGTAR